ncbi:MAG: hypothetical protein ACLGIN_17165 [Candidatus Sericytochromatia bacterium]
MPRILFALALATLPFAAPAIAAPDAPPPGHQRPAPSAEERAAWERMTPEEREAKRQARHAERERHMTPEQKARHEARRKEWEAMTPEQREAKMKERREKHQARRDQRPKQQRR